MERVRVGDVLRLERFPVDPEPTIDYVSIGIRSFGKGIFHYEPRPGVRLGRLRFFAVQPNRLVVSNIKAWEGAIAVSSETDAGCLASSRFLSYVPIDNRIDIRWARWYFLSRPGIELLQQASPGSADRNRTLAIDRFEALQIPLPPIDEQRRATDGLDKLSDLIAKTIQPRVVMSDATLAALGVAALSEAVIELRSQSSKFAALGELGIWSSGGTPNAKNPEYYGGGIPWAIIGDLNDDLVWATERTLTPLGIEQSSAKVVPPGTLLVAMYGSIGKLGLAKIELATNQAIACCQPKATIVSAEFLMSFLRCIRAELVELGQGGAQQNISQTLLKSVVAPIPNADEQAQFVTRINQIIQRVEQLRGFSHRRQLLASSLIPAALNEFIGDLKMITS